MMQRTASESAASTSSSKMSRRLGFALRKIGSKGSDKRDDRVSLDAFLRPIVRET